MRFTLPTFTRNPLMQAEWLYQRRTLPHLPWWRRLIERGTIGLALVVTVILFGIETAAALLRSDFTYNGGSAISILIVAVMSVIMGWHFILMLRTLTLSASSIARERQNQTWEALILTGVDSRAIVRGKWWATVRHLGWQYALLGVMRAGIVMWFFASSSRSIGTFYYQNGFSSVVPITPGLLNFLLGLPVLTSFTLLNLGFTAACGIAASAQSTRTTFALIRAFAFRFIMIIGTVFILYALALVSFGRQYGESVQLTQNVFLMMIGMLLDNGTTATGSLVHYTTPDIRAAVLSIPFALVIYALLTWGILRYAEGLAVKNHATPARRGKVSEESSISL